MEVANEIEDYQFYYDVETNLVDIDTRKNLVITTTHSTTAFTTVRIAGWKIVFFHTVETGYKVPGYKVKTVTK